MKFSTDEGVGVESRKLMEIISVIVLDSQLQKQRSEVEKKGGGVAVSSWSVVSK